MAIEKIGIYRKYHGAIPTDSSGKPLPKSEWPKKRAFRWAVRWFGSNGKRYSKSFRTRKEAERFSETKQPEIRCGKADLPEAITLEAFAAEHERIMCGQVAPATLCDQMRVLRLFMEHAGMNILLKKISSRDAESFISARLVSGVSVATVNKDIRTLKRIFNLAIEPRGYISAGCNPFDKIKQRKMSKKSIRYVSVREFRNLFNVATSTWWKAFLMVAYTTGARRSEILNLTWADIDFERNRIHIASKREDAHLQEWQPKDHEDRILPTPPETMQLLADLQAISEDECPYVFVPQWRWEYIQRARKTKNWNEMRVLVNNIGRHFDRLRKRAGIDKCTLHDLRRTCITNWAKVLPIHVVQKLTGHSDVKTTQEYYLSVQEDDLEVARQVQSKILSGDLTDPLLTHFAIQQK